MIREIQPFSDQTSDQISDKTSPEVALKKEIQFIKVEVDGLLKNKFPFYVWPNVANPKEGVVVDIKDLIFAFKFDGKTLVLVKVFNVDTTAFSAAAFYPETGEKIDLNFPPFVSNIEVFLVDQDSLEPEVLKKLSEHEL